MAVSKPIPLYPVYTDLKHINLKDYQQLCSELESLDDWQRQYWSWGKEYLSYIGRNKSEHTYVRFRNEVERFLLWTIYVKQQPLDTFRKSDILEYADFCWQPPLTWIATQNHDRFKLNNGYYESNSDWRPFKIQAAKSAADKHVDKNRYKPSQQTLTATFTAIISFYKADLLYLAQSCHKLCLSH